MKSKIEAARKERVGKLVCGCPQPRTAGRYFVYLTPRGEQMLGRLSVAHAEQLKRLASELILRLKRITGVQV
jgi:hypothetical protein